MKDDAAMARVLKAMREEAGNQPIAHSPAIEAMELAMARGAIDITNMLAARGGTDLADFRTSLEAPWRSLKVGRRNPDANPRAGMTIIYVAPRR